MRHGAFVPTAQVDTQKGERYARCSSFMWTSSNPGIRQMNMDYATTKAWNYGDFDDVPWIVWGYDVNCQYRPHHKERVEDSAHLSFPEGLDDKIYYAIGTCMSMVTRRIATHGTPPLSSRVPESGLRKFWNLGGPS